MIVLYILLVLLFLLGLILVSDISFILSLNNDFDFKIKIAGITLDLEKIASKSDKKSDAIKKDKPKKKKKPSLSDVLDLILYLFEVAKAVLLEFKRYARIKLCYVNIKVAGEDAFETAKLYGTVSAILYPSLEFFDSFMNIEKKYKKISVSPDFTSDEIKVDAIIIIKLKIIHVLLAGGHLIPTLAKTKKGK